MCIRDRVKALSIASKGIPGRTRTLDVLMGIMIVAEKGQVFLRTTDLEVYLSLIHISEPTRPY